jgi:4-hydroxybutyrate CoA-transferase
VTYDVNWAKRATSAQDVIAQLRSGQHVFVHGAAATPTPLLDALALRRDLEDVQLYHLHLAGPLRFADTDGPAGLMSNSLFTGPALRKPLEQGRAEFIPVFLSDIPDLFLQRRIPLDVALLQLSPPDRHGNCTLGTSVDTAKAAAESAPIILAEINERMPRTHGATAVPFSRVTAFVHSDRPLHAAQPSERGEVESQIAEHVATLVEDGATLQMGIGAVPDAVLERLTNKHDLGVHTEMFSGGLIPLIEAGVVTNRLKRVHPGRTVTSFVSGTQALFDYVHDNLLVEFHPCDRTNDTALIRKNPKVTAINAALEIDLSGQVCADSIGHRIFSGIGGQMDFIRGAALSAGGKPIITLPSTAAGGSLSRIVPMLKPGAGVVTTRGHVHYVVTEYGIANLHGLNLRERAQALIAIAHPDFRADLCNQARELRHFDLGASGTKR